MKRYKDKLPALEYTMCRPKPLRIADLCAGTGGFTLAFEQTHACVICVFAVDSCEASKTLYTLRTITAFES